MAEIVPIPSWLLAKSGEELTASFATWINATTDKLKRAFPPGERAFCRIIDKLKSRLPRRWRVRLHYTRQKPFKVADGVVFFGDFAFQNLSLLVEIDGVSHSGPVANEKDEWRSRLISMWTYRVARITNATVLDGDFRQVEKWFVEQAADACPAIHQTLPKAYLDMMRSHPAIYKAEGTMTTYKGS